MKGASEIDADIVELESEMAHLRVRNPGLYEFANAWAQRYDAILAATPQDLRPVTEQRLNRIGVRWGVAHGMRVTGRFPALEA